MSVEDFEELKRKLGVYEQEQAKADEEVYQFSEEGDLEKVRDALKRGGTPDGYKVRE